MQTENDNPRPFVETAITRIMQSRLSMTHAQRGICVIAGPPGIGKTRSIDRFVADQDYGCAVVKLEPGSAKYKGGVSQLATMQFAYEAIIRRREELTGEIAKRGYWNARRLLTDAMERYANDTFTDGIKEARFTFIFDEAQNLSREAIEMLRFWNDDDRPTLQFPVGLVFVGNKEFALKQDARGESVISASVRSRLLFEDQLGPDSLRDDDIRAFVRSCGVDDPEAVNAVMSYVGRNEDRRDLRAIGRRLDFVRGMLKGSPITAEFIETFFIA